MIWLALILAQGTPEEAVRAFVKAGNAKDLDGMKAASTRGTAAVLDAHAEMFRTEMNREIKLEAVDAAVRHPKRSWAMVSCRTEMGADRFFLRDEGKGWRVDMEDEFASAVNLIRRMKGDELGEGKISEKLQAMILPDAEAPEGWKSQPAKPEKEYLGPSMAEKADRLYSKGEGRSKIGYSVYVSDEEGEWAVWRLTAYAEKPENLALGDEAWFLPAMKVSESVTRAAGAVLRKGTLVVWVGSASKEEATAVLKGILKRIQ
jgi:hypothetical protein